MGCHTEKTNGKHQMITTGTRAVFRNNTLLTDAPLPEGRPERTIAAGILAAHHTDQGDDALHITFDALASHDITYVGIIQTARAGGLQKFPMPYALTNCHNSLCAVGGTINEDDHLFGLSAAHRYGGEYVPAHMAVIHQYMRETAAGCGKMILGSDSHTRYGALGTLGVGEGGPELVKQLLGRTYDIAKPEVVAVWLEGSPRPGVGPQDVALALVKAVFDSGLVKNRILEFMGPGVAGLSTDFRLGIDVMTTETTCLSSIWTTDDDTRAWLANHGREQDYKALAPGEDALYDFWVRIDLGKVEPMIALPFHPANAWSIREFLAQAPDLLAAVEKEATEIMDGKGKAPDLRSKLKGKDFYVDQGIIAGCSGGTYENIRRATQILTDASTGNGAFSLAVYPASRPQYLELVRDGSITALTLAGADIKTAFCGPCFGAGDVPANNAFSIRHTTRNFANREGSKPSGGQIAYVALMDARSIAATARNAGKLSPADELPDAPAETPLNYRFDPSVYEKRVYRGFGKPEPQTELIFGPNIADWPAMSPLPENLLLTVASAIYDPVTTTDELIPSGETSSYRSNPYKLAEFTLSRKDPEYVGRAKAARDMEAQRAADPASVADIFTALGLEGLEAHTGLGSVVFALKPGDGSAREQAASCQKVLGGWANLVGDYATKRYRSNLINWGMLPLTSVNAADLKLTPGDRIFLPGIRQALLTGLTEVPAVIHRHKSQEAITLGLPNLSAEERAIILAGCLINHYASQRSQG